MATLPRLKPKCFYDLVIEVAIIRPATIGRRTWRIRICAGATTRKPVSYYTTAGASVARTLGVPLFQEQMLQMAMVIATLAR